MTTYKSEMIEFRAGRIILTEAEWTANTNAYPEGIIAITSDGSNAGRTKVFNGTSYWSQLAYNSGGGSGAVTSDDVTVTGTMAPGPLTVSLDTLAQNVSDGATAITDLTTALGTIPKVYAFIANQTGTNAPTMTVQNNTLGGTVVWTRDSQGVYFGTLSGAFLASKTIILTQLVAVPGGVENGATIYLYRQSNNEIAITTNDGGTPTDGMLSNTGFKLEVYP